MPPPELRRCVGLPAAAAIMVGIIIGSGIFSAPSELARQCGDPRLILLFWAAGGVISLFGALTWAELATLLPQSGGIYVFLREAFGPAVAFVFGWTYMLVTKPAAAAAIAVIGAEHLHRLLGVEWSVTITTAVMLVVLTAINTLQVRIGGGVALLLTTLKVAALLAIVGIAVVLPGRAGGGFAPSPAPKALFDALAPAMAAVLWTYDGWSDVGAIAGEVLRPQKQLPRIFVFGTLLTTGIYLAVNSVFLWVLPLETMRGTETVAPLVLERLLGVNAATAVTVLIVIATVGSTHGSIITGARFTFAQARDGLLFGILAHIHPRHGTPDVSLWSQLALSVAAVWFFESFQRLSSSFVFSMWVFYGLAAAGVFVLRVRRPAADRPYRVWGYPVVPAAFVLAAAGMTVLGVRSSPSDAAVWAGVLAAGVPAYYTWRRFVPAPPGVESGAAPRGNLGV